MAPYDDSSDEGEDLEFTETNVLLGYADADSNGEKISRLGGRPEWLDEESPASAAFAKCKVCKDYMVLLLQLNAELPDHFPGHERRLYVFSCRRKSCRRKEGSIRAVRGVRVAVDAPTAKEDKKKTTAAVEQEKKEMPKASTLGLGEALFGAKPAASAGGGAKTNPFASVGGGSSVNPFAPRGTAAANPFAPKQQETPKPQEDTTSGQQQQQQHEEEQKQAEKDDLPKTFAQTLSLNNTTTTTTTQQTQTPAPAPSEPWPTDASALPPPYPERWIWDADYETLDPTPALPPQKIETMDIDTESTSGSGSGGGKEDKDVFESTMDAVFQRFADRVGQNPEQVIRYEFAGQPLLYSKNDAVGKLLHVPAGAANANEKVTTTSSAGKGKIPKCGNCGAGRVFEVQLTPHAIEELECEEDSMEGMDWGTIIVGVCEKDCSPRGTERGVAGYVEEWAGVQWEELSVKR
ncbi:programmed cell death protein 2 [Neurospora hispaniola]|uniref:Programmed cell death protein 2 n=1 Tax=Neurospora hispaniola TaxID=588809 RepID=A0AAJ0HYX6_9PEZI|nr:programmed cell death protein 2 [Neurospora hispaniola]